MKKVLAIGNSLVDFLVKIKDEQLLEELGLSKGSMTLVDKGKMHQILDHIKSFAITKSSGGSAANTIYGLAKLGVGGGFIGKTGEDEVGDFFRSDMENEHTNTHILKGLDETGKVIAFITEDSERTFATYLGASIELDQSDLHPAIFGDYHYFHLEGYLIHNQPLVERAIELAKKAGLKISFDLASFGVVKANQHFLEKMVKDSVDILFANEDEAYVFTNQENPQKALKAIADMCEIAVVKIGEKGSLIASGSKILNINPVQAQAIDTTGAGDLYASGFYYGLVNDFPLKTCGQMASIVAAKVVEVIGARMADQQWQEIREAIDKL